MFLLRFLQANLVASALKGKFPHRKLSSADEVLIQLLENFASVTAQSFKVASSC